MHHISTSPNDLQRELDLPRWNQRCDDLAELGIARPVSEDRLHGAATGVWVQCRRSKISPVQDIEHLRPKLYVERLRDSRDVVVLQHGEIDAEQSGSDDRIASQVAANVGTVPGEAKRGSAYGIAVRSIRSGRGNH